MIYFVNIGLNTAQGAPRPAHLTRSAENNDGPRLFDLRSDGRGF